MELDLQGLFGLNVYTVLIDWDPATPLLPPTFRLIYEVVISQPRSTTSLCNPLVEYNIAQWKMVVPQRKSTKNTGFNFPYSPSDWPAGHPLLPARPTGEGGWRARRAAGCSHPRPRAWRWPPPGLASVCWDSCCRAGCPASSGTRPWAAGTGSSPAPSLPVGGEN